MLRNILRRKKDKPIHRVDHVEGISRKALLPRTLEAADLSKHLFQFTKATGESNHHLTQHAKEVVAQSEQVLKEMKSINEQMDTIIDAVVEVDCLVKQNGEASHASIHLIERSSEELGQAVDKIEGAITYYKEIIESIKQLNGYSRNIWQVTNHIDGIANQTAMIAINANIEAARAGDIGEGFHVITEEIKHLATQSKDFSKHINETLSSIKVSVDEMDNKTQISFKKIEHTQLNIIKLNTLLNDIIAVSKNADAQMHQTTHQSKEVEKGMSESKNHMLIVDDLLDQTNAQTHRIKQTVEKQQAHITILESINNNVKDLSAQQLDLVMGNQVKEEMIKIAQALRDYDGDKDAESIRKLCVQYHASHIYFGNESGTFIYSDDQEGIGLNLFSFDEAFERFYHSEEIIKVFPLARNLLTGDVTQFVGAKHQKSKMFISIGFELEGIIQLYNKGCQTHQEINDLLEKKEMTPISQAFQETKYKMDSLTQAMSHTMITLEDCSNHMICLVGKTDGHMLALKNNMKGVVEAVVGIERFVVANKTYLSKTRQQIEESHNKTKEIISEIEEVANYYSHIIGTLNILRTYSENISTITSNMNAIARKTALLAVNASIEATKTGELGRGFLVITHEIKQLAEKTNNFSETIEEMLAYIKTCVITLDQITQSNFEKILETKEAMVCLEKVLEEVLGHSDGLNEELATTTTTSHKMRKWVEEEYEKIGVLQEATYDVHVSIEAIEAGVKIQAKHMKQLRDVNTKIENLEVGQ